MTCSWAAESDTGLVERPCSFHTPKPGLREGEKSGGRGPENGDPRIARCDFHKGS